MGSIRRSFQQCRRNMADPNQPRQPRDMKGLLKFCFEATRGEDAPDISDPESVLNNMEPEKRAWLEQALKNMSVDVVEQLTSGIKILNSDDADDDDQCQVKALYAISCISRDSASSLSTLTSLDAWSVLLRAVQRDNVKLVTKGC